LHLLTLQTNISMQRGIKQIWRFYKWLNQRDMWESYKYFGSSFQSIQKSKKNVFLLGKIWRISNVKISLRGVYAEKIAWGMGKFTVLKSSSPSEFCWKNKKISSNNFLFVWRKWWKTGRSNFRERVSQNIRYREIWRTYED
jgi:hypothetical protein